jgi:hypothetical protein
MSPMVTVGAGPGPVEVSSLSAARGAGVGTSGQSGPSGVPSNRPGRLRKRLVVATYPERRQSSGPRRCRGNGGVRSDGGPCRRRPPSPPGSRSDRRPMYHRSDVKGVSVGRKVRGDVAQQARAVVKLRRAPNASTWAWMPSLRWATGSRRGRGEGLNVNGRAALGVGRDDLLLGQELLG